MARETNWAFISICDVFSKRLSVGAKDTQKSKEEMEKMEKMNRFSQGYTHYGQ